MRNRTVVIRTSICALLVAVLHRYWLVTPVLHYVSIGRWRLVAMLVAFAIGCVMSMLRLPIVALVGACIAGLFLGGTWAEWQAPSDVPIAITDAFASYLESFWGQLILLTVVTALGGLCGDRLVKNNRPTPS
jgi:hypothetical protein